MVFDLARVRDRVTVGRRNDEPEQPDPTQQTDREQPPFDINRPMAAEVPTLQEWQGISQALQRFGSLELANAIWHSVAPPAPDNRLDSVVHAFQQWGDDPAFIAELTRHWWAFLAAPEVIVAVRAEIGEVAVPEIDWSRAIMEAMIGSTYPELQQELVDNVLRTNPLVAEWFTDHGTLFKESELGFLEWALASVPPDRRDRIVSRAEYYLRDNPLISEDARTEFLGWFYAQASQEQAHHLSNLSTVGSVGEFFAIPFRAVGPAVTSVGLRMLTSPDDYKWRSTMSFGENLAIGLGQNPADPQWTYTSGAFDFLANFILDPVNIAVGFGIGAKLARSTAAVGRLADMSRIERATRLVVPYYGRRISMLPKFSRGPFTRMGWGIFSKTADQMVDSAKAAGVFDDMWRIIRTARAQGEDVLGELVERYPQLKNNFGGLFDIIVSDARQGPAEIEMAFRAATKGLFTEGGTQSVIHLANIDLAHSQNRLQQALRQGAADGTIHPSSILVSEDGLGVGLRGSGKPLEVRVGGIADEHVVKSWGEGQSLGWSHVSPRADNAPPGAYALFDIANPKVLDVSDPAQLRPVMGWLAGHGSRGNRSAAVIRLEEGLTDLTQRGLGPKEASDWLAFFLQQDQAARRIFERYLSNNQIHMLGSPSAGVLTPYGARFTIRGSDTPQSIEALNHLSGLQAEVFRARARIGELHAGGGRSWIVKDFPTKPPSSVKMVTAGAWRRHGPRSEGDVGSWWYRTRRWTSSFLYSPANPGAVDINNAEMGVRTLTSMMRRMGAPRELINRWMIRFARATPAERYDVVGDAIEAAAEAVNHPNLQYGIIQMSRNQRIRSYAYDDNGVEVGLRFGRGLRGNQVVASPIIPHHTKAYVQLPGHEVFASLRRTRRAQRLLSGPPVLRPLIRGVLPSVRKRREALVNRIRPVVAEAAGIDPKDVDPNQLLTMAYAVTRPYRQLDMRTGKVARGAMADDWVHGLGIFAQAGHGLGRAYSMFHRGFSIMQLIGRPISWMLRVNMEEQWRAAQFDLPSFFRNPFRQMAGWYDSFFVSRHRAWHRRQVSFVNQTVDRLFTEGTDVTEAFERALRIAPEFRTHLAGNIPGNLNDLRRSFSKFLSDAVVTNNNMSVLNLRNNPARIARLRATKMNVSRRRLQEIGLEPEFRIQDIDEIRNVGFGQLVIEAGAAGSYPVDFVPGQMTRTALFNYGGAWAATMHNLVHDPIVGVYGLGRIAARGGHGTTRAYDGATLARSRAWQTIRHEIAKQVDYRGLRFGSETELADWYLVNILDPYTQNIFGPLLGRNPQDAAQIANDLRRSQRATVNVGGTRYDFDFDTGGMEWMARTARQFVDEQHLNPDITFARKISAFFEPRLLGADSRFVREPRMQRAIRTGFAIFGDEISQFQNRRPAWLHIFRDHFRHYKAAGFTDDMARAASELKATETVNYVFYNMKNVVPFLRRANKVTPFFSAWWEVAQTWSYKIPMQSAWGLGYAGLIRRVDRFFNALISMGILEVGDEDPRSPTRTRQMRLAFSADPNTRNPFGRTLSKAGWWAWRSLGVAVHHMVNIANLWADSDEEFGDPEGWLGRNTFTLSVGKPIDPFSFGFGAVNQLYVGINPLLARGLTRALEQMSEAVDYTRITSEEGESLVALAERAEVNLDEFRVVNDATLREVLGAEKMGLLVTGVLDPESITIPAGTILKVPDTNLWATVVEDFLLPFGRIQTTQGVAWAVLPGWSQYVMRGLGLWAVGPDWNKRLPGESDDVLRHAAGFLGVFDTPLGRAQVSGEVITQMQYLEATERLLTRLTEAERTLREIEERSQGQLVVEILEDGTPSLLSELGEDHPLEIEWHEAQDLVRALSDELLHRATSNAAGALVMRGLIGLYSPGVPGMLYEQNRELQTYYYGRDVQQKVERGEFDPTALQLPQLRVGGEENYQAFLTLLGNWLSDPRGDLNKMFLLENYPEMLPFVFGKTYWEPGGEPPEITDIEQHTNYVQQGLRKAYPPIVWMQRTQLAILRMEQEIDIRNQFGSDQEDQAQSILHDWYAYNELKRDYDVHRAGLALSDELFYDGEYERWRKRHQDDEMTLFSRLNDFVANIGEVISEIADPTADFFGMFDPNERRVLAGQMRELSRTLRGAVGEWRREHGPERELNRRDHIMAEYFAGPVASFYEGLGELYEQANTTTDSADRALIYNEIRQYESTIGLAPAEVEGVLLPAPLVWRWSAYGPEEKQEAVTRWVAGNAEWLSRWSVSNILQFAPHLEQYLPTGPDAFDIYDHAAQQRRMIREAQRPGSFGEESLITSGRAAQFYGELNDWTRRELVAAGRGAEAAWLDMSPVQKLSIAGMLPDSLHPFVPMVNAAMDALAQMEVGPSSIAGLRIFSYILGEVQRRGEVNPAVIEAFEDLGMLLYDEAAHNVIVMKLFAGETFQGAGL